MILDRLRQSTADAHHRVEGHLLLMSPDLTLPMYRHTLTQFYSVYAPLEARLQAAAAGTALTHECAARAKIELLRRDLRTLGCAEAELRAITPARTLPSFVGGDEGSILGAMYVMEGATLGGQHIRKHVSQALGLTTENGLAFFSSYGQRVGAMWSAFRSLLTATPDSCHDAIVTAALATFACFESALSTPLAACAGA